MAAGEAYLRRGVRAMSGPQTKFVGPIVSPLRGTAVEGANAADGPLSSL